jgi:twitching motility protein PilT
MDVTLEALLAECVRLDASDLHLAPEQPPFFRIHGELAPHPHYPPLSRETVHAFAGELLAGTGARRLETTGSQDGALTGPGGTRFRFNVYRRMGGLSVALRRLEDRFRTLRELGLPESLYGFCDLPDGIVVVAGPTGAGKSTTLAALVDRINRSRRSHIITIEDPIEYIHLPVKSLVDQRQVGSDTPSFNDALVASLREDPDVLLVGEARDLDTIRTALRAAETGHLVFTTVHAGDAVGTLERLVSVFPADEQAGIRQQLALVLRAIVAQHLLPAADGRGRVVATEILIGTPAVAHLVAAGKTSQVYAAVEGGGPHGMRTLEQDLARLWVEGRISEGVALSASRNPSLVRDRAALLRRSLAAGVRS